MDSLSLSFSCLEVLFELTKDLLVLLRDGSVSFLQSFNLLFEHFDFTVDHIEPFLLSVLIIHSSLLVFLSKSVLHGELVVLQVADVALDIIQLSVEAVKHVPKVILFWLDLHEEVIVFLIFQVKSTFEGVEELELGVVVGDNIIEVGLL